MYKWNFITDGFKGIFRNGIRSVASILILGSSLLLVSIFATLMSVIDISIDQIDDFNEIVVYMSPEATKEQVEAAEDAIKALDNVKSVTFISKAQALENEKGKFPGFEYIFESYDDTTNPLPDHFIIEYNDLEKVDALVYKLKRLDIDGDGKDDGVVDDGGDGVVDGNKDGVKNRSDIAVNISKFKNIISLAGTWLMIMLIVLSVFVISNTIRLTYYSREMEISVMRYIGATRSYILMPFVFEGAVMGFLSGLFGYFIQYYIYMVPIAKLAEEYGGFISIPQFAQINPLYLLIFFVAGTVLGLIGSGLAIRKYTKV